MTRRPASLGPFGKRQIFLCQDWDGTNPVVGTFDGHIYRCVFCKSIHCRCKKAAGRSSSFTRGPVNVRVSYCSCCCCCLCVKNAITPLLNKNTFRASVRVQLTRTPSIVTAPKKTIYEVFFEIRKIKGQCILYLSRIPTQTNPDARRTKRRNMGPNNQTSRRHVRLPLPHARQQQMGNYSLIQ